MKKLFALAVIAAAAAGAQAQDFPGKDKVITIVVPFAAGGPTDRVARDMAEAMRKPLGGISIAAHHGSEVDLSGGGDLLGAAFMAGRGGSANNAA